MTGAMTEAIQNGFVAGMYFTAPVLIIAALLGLVIGIIQASIQLQEQTVPQILKIFIVAGIVIVFGAGLSRPIVDFSEKAFYDVRRNGR